jgi:hypothetical protein
VLFGKGRIDFGGGVGVPGEMVRAVFQLRSAIGLRLSSRLCGLLVPDVSLSLVREILSEKGRLSRNRELGDPPIRDLAIGN